MKVIATGKKKALKSLSVQNKLGESLDFRLRRKFYGILSIARNDGLTWNYTESSRLKMEYILIKRVVKESINQPRFLFQNLFNNFEIHLRNLTASEMPIKICTNEQTKIWVSRVSVAQGIWPSDIEPKLEYDRIRDPSQFGILVRNVIPSPSESNYNPMSVSRVCSSIRETEGPYNTVENVQIAHGKIILKDCELVDRGSISITHSGGKLGFITSQSEQIFVLRTFKSLPGISKGIFLGSNTSWYHFVCEYLPLIMLFPESIRNSCPIIVESAVHKNILEVIKILTGVAPIPVGNFESLEVGELHYIKDIEKRRKELGKDRLVSMSQHILEILELADNSPKDKIYLVRDDKLFRPLQNRKQVLKYLTKLGFRIVNPSKLTFTEQVEIMSEAKVVVSESGAALTNMIFCPSGTVLVELQRPGGIPNFWFEFSQNFGIRHYCVVGKKRILGDQGLASDGFIVPLKELRKTLDIIPRW